MSEKMDTKPDVNTEAAELKLLKKREQLAAAREKAKSNKVEREQKLRDLQEEVNKHKTETRTETKTEDRSEDTLDHKHDLSDDDIDDTSRGDQKTQG